MAKAPDFPVAPILEHLGAHNVPYVTHGYKRMLCPFHDDRRPSANVSKYGFNCFSCCKSGDAIKLLREEGLSFEDAVTLAEKLTGGTDSEIPPASGWAMLSISGNTGD